MTRSLFPTFSVAGVLPSSLTNPLTKTTALADDALPSLNEIGHWSSRLTQAVIVTVVVVGLALAIHFILFRLLRQAVGRRVGEGEHEADSVALRQFNQSVRWALVAIAISFGSEASKLLYRLWTAVDDFVVPALFGWVLLSLLRTLAEILERRAERYEDEITARSRRTRIALLTRVLAFVIIFVTASTIMLGIPGVRHIGATLMASAGLIGLAVGAAAQPALKSLIAGLQIAVTEPIRIGDFVVVEGESGRVEDIRLSYVVVRSADERRMIIPTIKFLDSTFQNWTRVGGITGSVVLPIRPGHPIGPIRTAYETILGEQDGWDKRTGTLIVSEAHVGSVELKLVMSASDPTALTALRLAMREAMLEWLRAEMPDALCVDTP